MLNRFESGRGMGVPGALRSLLLVALIGLAGCDFTAENPTAVTVSDLQSDAAMTALMVGAVGSYNTSYDRQIMFAGLVADELTASGSWITWHMADKEGVFDMTASESDHINITWRFWTFLQRARANAEEVAERMEEFLPSIGQDPHSDPRFAIARLYAGATYLDFAELWCSAAYDGGPEVPTRESYDIAISRLNQAIAVAQAAGADSTVARANLLLARAYMGIGNDDAALSAARAVPQGMMWVAHMRDASGERSYFWDNNANRGESSVDPTFRDTGDPRVPVVNTGRVGPDTETIVWQQMKYPDRNSDFIIGKWEEARLIEAEILIDRGEIGAAISLLNEVRAASELEPYAVPGSADEAFELLRYERMHELFLEGRRMIDMRRWNEFPQGWQATCFPIADIETRSNPNL